MTMDAKFPRFWYESNACWGWVESVEDLVEKCRLQQNSNGVISTVDDFLNFSRNCYTDNSTSFNFGTRSEHSQGTYTLKEFLEEYDLLQEFLSVA